MQEQTLPEQGPDNLDLFVSDLLKAKGLTDDEAAHAELLGRINDRIDRVLLENLPGDKLDFIEKSIDDGTVTEESVTETIENSGMNSSEIILAELEKFRDEYLSEA